MSDNPEGNPAAVDGEIDAEPLDKEPEAVTLSNQASGDTATQKAWRFVTADYGQRPRWLLVFAVLLACIYGLFTSSFSICSDQTVSKGAEKTITQTCKGPAVSDAGVVALALLIVLLVAPDMSEVGAFGVSLKRRLAAAEEKASESKAKSDALETRLLIQDVKIESLSQSSAAASAHAKADIFINQLPINFQELAVSSLHDKEEALQLSMAAGPAADSDHLDERVVPNAEKSVRLIRNWEILAASLDLPPHRRGGRPDIPRVKVSGLQAERFDALFADQLQVVRAARNSVAHSSPITDQELDAAVNISEELLRILRGY